MEINSAYDVVLHTTINGVLSISGGILEMISSSATPLVAPTIEYHINHRYVCPDGIKNINIYASTFYHFRLYDGSLIVVPKEYISVCTKISN